jgi:hypothetical protein
MHTTEKKQFMAMLAETMTAYGKPLPDGALLGAWWSNLEPFPLRAVAMAFSEYRAENGEFPPVPAGIAKRCKALDGRPDAEEAWALALTCRDEAITVVWTCEIAEAFGICKAVLDSGDEIGARMAFREAYKRLVLDARIRNQPAKWTASFGSDKQARTLALEKAVRSGHLAIENVTMFLSAPASSVNQDGEQEKNRENIKKLMEMMGTLKPASEKMREARERACQAERDAIRNAKQAAENRTREFQKNRSTPSGVIATGDYEA